MSHQLNMREIWGRRYALCVGIGHYTELSNRDLRFAVTDAEAIAHVLGDPEKGNFQVKLLTEPSQTTKHALEGVLDQMLSAPYLKPEDIVLIYFSCHGSVYGKGNTFYLLPSDAVLTEDGLPKKTTVIDIHDLAKTLSGARVKNIVLLLDACYSGGAGATLQHLNLDNDLSSDTNLFIIGAARHDQSAIQVSSARHGLFTSCLLQAFKQRPRRSDGWLTISEIQSHIAELVKISDITNTVQIQVIYAAVNPNLLITKNPQYEVKSREFHEQVKKLLILLKYEPIEIEEVEDTPPGFYTADISVGLRVSRVGIISYFNQVEPLSSEEAQKIASFIKTQIELQNLEQGIIVTVLELSNEIKEGLKYIVGNLIEIRTYENIWKGLIDFRKYLYKLINDYENCIDADEVSLANTYIPLNAELRSYEREPYRITWQGDAEERVKQWLFETVDSRLALLADYGSGKTTFCRHIAALLAKEYLERKINGYYESRIPLLIPLLDFAKAPFELESYLVAYLQKYCKVNNPDFNVLMKMAEAGLFLFILDGFDEMASRANTDVIQKNIALFERLARLPRNKVLLTARPEYFMNFSQEQQVLRAYPYLYLQPFNKEQINFYLQKRIPLIKQYLGDEVKDWTYYRQKIDEIHDLSDLARRPVLLEMIIKTLPALIEEGKVINRPNLYQSYLDGELKRQQLKERFDLQINRQKRFEIVEQIAFALYQSGKLTFTSRQIIEISKELLTFEQQAELEESLREILTCSFLIRIVNEYRFSHESFMEYLVACRFAKNIIAGKQEEFCRRPIKTTIRNFLVELELHVAQRDLKAFDIFNTNINFDCGILIAWFCNNARNAYISSNTISILVKLLNHDQFCDLPLSGADLSGADLSGADLSGADLSGADLSGADLSGADLSGADLSGADLSGADLSGTKLTQVNLKHTKLDFANLEHADISYADLRYIDFEAVVFKGTNLSHVNLKYADLHNMVLRTIDMKYAMLLGADLSRANLREADLSMTNLCNASLYGADLTRANLRGAELNGADLREADLRGINLNGADLRRVDLTETVLSTLDLSEVDLSRSNLRGVNLNGTNLSGADLSGANLSGADLSGADLSEADLSDTDLSGANLSEADLSGANLSDTDLSGVDLRNLNLSRVNLSGMGLQGVDLSGADLDDADLSDADLSDAKLHRTNLSGADLSDADLSDADLSDADLQRTKLNGANLVNVNLSRANLDDATLDETNLSGSNFSYVSLAKLDLSRANLSGADLSRASFINIDVDKIDLSEAYLGDMDLEMIISQYSLKREDGTEFDEDNR